MPREVHFYECAICEEQYDSWSLAADCEWQHESGGDPLIRHSVEPNDPCVKCTHFRADHDRSILKGMSCTTSGCRCDRFQDNTCNNQATKEN